MRARVSPACFDEGAYDCLDSMTCELPEHGATAYTSTNIATLVIDNPTWTLPGTKAEQERAVFQLKLHKQMPKGTHLGPR